jgi:hypothetical protein
MKGIEFWDQKQKVLSKTAIADTGDFTIKTREVTFVH